MSNDWQSTLVRGKQPHPPRICIYGTHGIGKSSLAAMFPAPIFINTERGIDNLDVVSFPPPTSIGDVVGNIRMLIKEEHAFKTLVIDTADWLIEPLIVRAVEAKHDAQELSYGKGAIYIAEGFREILQGLDRLRLKGMNVILLAHAAVVRFDSPTSEPFDRYIPNLQKRCNALLMEWCDMIAFANFRVIIKKSDVGFSKEVARGVTTGERLLHFTETPGYVAKNRCNAPDTCPMTIQSLASILPIAGMTPAVAKAS
jgi:hypothetical protein